MYMYFTFTFFELDNSSYQYHTIVLRSASIFRKMQTLFMDTFANHSTTISMFRNMLGWRCQCSWDSGGNVQAFHLSAILNLIIMFLLDVID